jgi:hypothetical protein
MEVLDVCIKPGSFNFFDGEFWQKTCLESISGTYIRFREPVMPRRGLI